ncbi:hypothetical protein BBBOND_0202980 [Babesia bigemina]|uniref:Uncharacterized protein n=1 Tax=Babesia bigemina TaxID=5866 RepID=A0A061D2Z3_BABBI|nr:hypothetical protein BBBOND_0202980 [Babesia bigemina]CDR95141.1 hypothetical protein BBBOND_0202980 [Babesia bigemina]|eukprot:XP_012767327.1 hypothetical protein BBBOND_0202980 [Babesia bigemina]
MVFNSLTEAPHNLKEGIDWLVALKGDDAESNIAALGAAIYNFLVDKPVGHTEIPALEKVKLNAKDFMGQSELRGLPYVKDLLTRYSSPVKKPTGLGKVFNNVDESDYKNVVQTRKMKPEKITQYVTEAINGCEKFLGKIKTPDQYESAYGKEATWEASCSEKPEDCAAVFVGIAPMLYAGLRSLRRASNVSPLQYIGIRKKPEVGGILTAMGYEESYRRSPLNASNVFAALQSVSHRTLVTFYDLSGFWAFYGSGKIGAVREEQPVEPVIPEAEPSVDGEGEQSVIPEAEPSVDGEGEQSVIPEAEPSVDGEGEQSVIPEAEPSVEGEGEQSMIPEAEPSVEPAGEEPVIPEAEPSVEPVKPEVDDVEQPVKIAKAAKVARSVKAAKKAAKKVSKKARQKKEKKQKKQQEQQESAEQ